MGLFNFGRSKRKKGKEFSEILRTPDARKAMGRMEIEHLKKEVDNLRTVGREKEANKRVSEHFQARLLEWKKDPIDLEPIGSLADIALQLGALDAGVESLKIVIQVNEENPITDLTTVYFDLGRIYHLLYGTCEMELWAFHMATQCEPPPKCRLPATPAQKAKAHFFASSCAKVLMNEEHATYHDRMARQIVPDLNWDDTMAVVKWIQTN